MIVTVKKNETDSQIDFYWDNKKYLGTAYREVDGYYVILNSGGFWSDYALKEISDKLLELNKEWDEQIENDLKK